MYSIRDNICFIIHSNLSFTLALLIRKNLKMTKKVCAITGGTSGIGKGCVEKFVKDGYEVVFCGRNTEAGSKVASENKATFIKCDVTKPEEVESFFAQVNILDWTRRHKGFFR